MLQWGVAYLYVSSIPDTPRFITVTTYDTPTCKKGTIRSVESWPGSVCIEDYQRQTSVLYGVMDDYELGLSWEEMRYADQPDCSGNTERDNLEEAGNFDKMWARNPDYNEAKRRGKTCVLGRKDEPCYGPNPFLNTCIRVDDSTGVTMSAKTCPGDPRINAGDAKYDPGDADFKRKNKGKDRIEFEFKPDAGGFLVLAKYSDSKCRSLVKTETYNITSYHSRQEIVPFSDNWGKTYFTCTEGRGRNSEYFFQVINVEKSAVSGETAFAGSPKSCKDHRHYFSKQFLHVTGHDQSTVEYQL